MHWPTDIVRKRLTEKRNDAPPAQRLGLVPRALAVEEVLSRRLFPTLQRLPERLARYYRRETETRRIPGGRIHHLSYAF